MLSAQLISFVEAVHDKPHCLFCRVKDSCAFRNCFADICFASAVFVSSGLYCIVKQPLFINVYFVFWFWQELQNRFELVWSSLVFDHAISVYVQSFLLREHRWEQQVLWPTLEHACFFVFLHLVLWNSTELTMAVVDHDHDVAILAWLPELTFRHNVDVFTWERMHHFVNSKRLDGFYVDFIGSHVLVNVSGLFWVDLVYLLGIKLHFFAREDHLNHGLLTQAVSLVSQNDLPNRDYLPTFKLHKHEACWIDAHHELVGRF